MPKPKQLTRLVRNNYSRWGIKPRLAILHTTEGHNRPGVSDLTSLAAYFNGPNGLSAHYGVDSQGNRIRMVADARTAYTVGRGLNSLSLNIEQIAFAYTTTRRQWILDHHRQLYAVAAILADWHEKYGIPLKFSRWRGVCEHRHVSGIGGHGDCGKNYPLDYVITWALLIHERRKPKGKQRRSKIRAWEHTLVRNQHAVGKRPETRPW